MVLKQHKARLRRGPEAYVRLPRVISSLWLRLSHESHGRKVTRVRGGDKTAVAIQRTQMQDMSSHVRGTRYTPQASVVIQSQQRREKRRALIVRRRSQNIPLTRPFSIPFHTACFVCMLEYQCVGQISDKYIYIFLQDIFYDMALYKIYFRILHVCEPFVSSILIRPFY